MAVVAMAPTKSARGAPPLAVGYGRTEFASALEFGRQCMTLGDFRLAIEYLAVQVLAVAPTHLVARRDLGDALCGVGGFREAVGHYTAAAGLESQKRDRLRRQQSMAMNITPVSSIMGAAAI